jgi:hypothetical protein
VLASKIRAVHIAEAEGGIGPALFMGLEDAALSLYNFYVTPKRLIMAP